MRKGERMKYINDLVKKLEQKGIDMQSCNDTEILTFKKNITDKYELPEAYLEFIKKMGRGTKNQFMGGESCYIDEIEDLKAGAIELLEENESLLTLNENDYVFWMSQGCMFCFFKLNEGDNPPVYYYNEAGEDKFVKITNTLTEFWINRLDMNKDLFKSVD